MSNEKDFDNKQNRAEERPVNRQDAPEDNLSEEISSDEMLAMAREYAKALASSGLKPGDPTFIDSADTTTIGTNEKEVVSDYAGTGTDGQTSEALEEKKKKEKRKRRKPLKIKRRPYEKSFKGISFLSKIIDLRDRAQKKTDDVLDEAVKEFVVAFHSVSSTYRNSRRTIGTAILGVTVVITGILILFDRFTVYEYAYNGKVLGYVREQEEVTDVLDIAGQKLTENSGSALDVKFVANQNITFSEVEAGGKVLDTSDAAVNKLVYMTDIETEAYGVYDGSDLIAVVKDNNDAENLLVETQEELSRPDSGMQLVSSEFANTLDVKPLNVLLISVQDNTSARQQMIEGGNMEIYHIVEEGEDLRSLQEDFSVSAENIYDETNTEVAAAPEQGDRVCIHKTVEPLSVTMVESGRMKEVVEFKTVKKESDEYYKGDTVIQQEGEDGVQIFEGTITKEKGKVVDRKTDSIETVRKVQDKIIVVGTAERPKTAATGTFAMPLKDSYQLSSPFGPRWGRMHTGLDMARGVGIPIYASDGGTVIRAGYNGGYGLCVDIDHENGYVTRYAHCSKLLVSVGDKVYQGQNISLMGSTGNSTGPHLHFEIIQNGTAINPAPKLGL